MMDKAAVSAQPAPSVWRSIKLVAWSFLGVRSNAEYQQDLAKVSPLHVVAVGLVAVMMMVVGLIALVHWVVAK